MSREIVEAIKGLEQEKGIDADTLMAALEDVNRLDYLLRH